MRRAASFEDWLEKKLRANRFRQAYRSQLPSARVAVKIARLRQEARLSQQDLAQRMGTSQQAVARLERGDYEGMTFSTLTRLADALGAQLVVDFRRKAV